MKYGLDRDKCGVISDRFAFMKELYANGIYANEIYTNEIYERR